MVEFESRSPLEKDEDTSIVSGKGRWRFLKRVGLIAAGMGIGLVLLASIA